MKSIISVPRGGRVLDVGCLSFSVAQLARECGREDLRQAGVDYMDLTAGMPAGLVFRRADLNKDPIPFEDDSFDLVVASHIIEHLDDGIVFAMELIRVLKPGGILYIEAPSERALWLPSMPFERDQFFSLSFYDDPTHRLRPWPPQSIHRLFRYLQCVPREVGYHTSFWVRCLSPFLLLAALLMRNGLLLQKTVWKTFGWASYGLIQKPENLRGVPTFSYFIPKGDLPAAGELDKSTRENL